MRLGVARVREKFTHARVARCATADAAAVPHLVPVTFAVSGDVVVIAVDHKPKATTNLRRLRNIEANPAVCLLVDEYTEQWSQLWWARADGHATIRRSPADPERATAVRLLCDKYPQYAARPPEGPVIHIDVHTWSGWAAS